MKPLHQNSKWTIHPLVYNGKTSKPRRVIKRNSSSRFKWNRVSEPEVFLRYTLVSFPRSLKFTILKDFSHGMFIRISERKAMKGLAAAKTLIA